MPTEPDTTPMDQIMADAPDTEPPVAIDPTVLALGGIPNNERVTDTSDNNQEAQQ